MSAPAAFKSLLGSRCIDAPERLQPYQTPERGEPGHTGAVLLPANEAEVQAILLAANLQRLRLVVCAGRTGLVEAQRPLGETVLSLEKLQRPLQFCLANGEHHRFQAEGNLDGWTQALADWYQAAGRPDTAGAEIEVEAGLAVDSLNTLLAPLGLMFPMEMGSTASASVGACAANASAGANALCYGTGAHMTVAAWGFTGDGTPIGPCTAEPWRTPRAGVLAVNSAELHEHWGLLGSQGTLGLITRLRLRLFPVPRQREAALIPVRDMAEAMRVLDLARSSFPDAVEEFEFMSRHSVALVRELRGDAMRLPFEQEPEDPYLLLMQIKSADEEEDLAGALYAFLSETLALADERIGYGPLHALKHIRHSITESSNARMRKLGGGRLAFDTATPIDVFGPYLDALTAAVNAVDPGLEVVAFGHAGVGGAHLHILGTPATPITQHGAALTRLVIDVTLAHGGTFSAEHGIGSKWADEFLRRTPAARLEELAALKCQHDPNNILNPRSFGFDRLLQTTAA